MSKTYQGFTKPEISEKWFEDCRPQDKRHLLNSLRSLMRGHPTTPCFPLYGKTDWSVVDDFFESLKSQNIIIPKWLYDYEYSRKEKFGPQGGFAPWSELKENADLYWSRNAEVEEQHEVSIEHYSSIHVDMLTVKDALKTLKNDQKIQTRASGWPTFDCKKTDVYAQQVAVEYALTSKWKEGWAYFFSRFNKMKKRLFMPMPYCIMLKQAQYFNPFLKAIQTDLRANGIDSPFVFWADKLGFEFCFHTIIQGLLRKHGVTKDNVVYVMRDFDKMDTSTGVSQKKSYFVPRIARAFHYGNDTSPYRLLEEAMLISNTCPIATPDGMRTGSRGEGSGATVTNGGETCCNEEFDGLFVKALTERILQHSLPVEVIVDVGNGDDGQTILKLLRTVTEDEYNLLKSDIVDAANYAASITKFIVQAEKWDIRRDYGKYCQFLEELDEHGLLHAMYPASLILNSIINPEKEYKPSDWDKDYRDIEIIMKLDNGRELPYFTQLIDYVDNGMRFRLLGRSEEATRRILSKYDKYRALRDSSYDYNVYNSDVDTKGLLSSPTVQYLIQKRHYNISE